MEKNTSLLKCSSHELSLMAIYCEDCECPVCTKCITGSHMKHNLLDVSTYVARQKEELMASIYEDCSKIENFRGALTEMKTNTEEKKNKVLEEISKREDAIIAEVKAISADYRSIVGEAALQHRRKIEQNEVTLLSISKISELKLETEADCIELLHCRSELRRIESEMKNHDSVHISFEVMKDYSKTKLEEIFGTVCIDNEVNQSSDDERPKEKKESSYCRNIENILKTTKKKFDKNVQPICIVYKVDGINRFVSGCKGIFFSGEKIYTYLDDEIFVQEKERKVYQVVKNVQHCMKHSSENGLLVVTNGESELGFLLQNGNYISIFKTATSEEEKIVDVADSTKTGITILLVKTIKQDGRFMKSKVSMYQVNITGESKEVSCMYEEKTKKNLKICTLNDTRQLVFNLDESLFAYNQELTLKFRYSGCRGANPSAKFSVSFVCLDLENNILVADSSDKTIHMLSIDGKFLKIIIWPEDNVKVKWLSVDTDGWLWIGQGGYPRTSDFCVFDYEYLKKTERTERALTESEEKIET